VEEGEGVIVILGGGDLLRQGHRAASELARLGMRVTLIQGPLATSYEQSPFFEVLVDPPDLPSRLATSGWLVTNGGSCMFEAMCLGKATFVLPQTQSEAVLAKSMLERGGLLGVGLENLKCPDKAAIRDKAERAAELVDGRGAERIATIVKSLL